MATCSCSSTRTTLPTYVFTFAKYTSHTTCPSTSTYNSDYNDTILSTPSTYRSQRRTEGSHREETRKTTPSGPSTSAYSDGQRTSSFSCLS